MRDTKWNDIWLGKFLGWKRPNSPVMQCHIPAQYPHPQCYENLRNDNAKYFSFLDYFFGKKTLQLMGTLSDAATTDQCFTGAVFFTSVAHNIKACKYCIFSNLIRTLFTVLEG
jgi:hypothetical protein